MKDGGRIVMVSSGLARFSLPGYSAYAAMKGGIAFEKVAAGAFA
jgi:NAD(P)-dependent dehydrogenase (short-subunit alcohol dehydrogenase family)